MNRKSTMMQSRRIDDGVICKVVCSFSDEANNNENDQEAEEAWGQIRHKSNASKRKMVSSDSEEEVEGGKG